MDKIDKLLDALEHPESFTRIEIEEMLSDPKVKDTMDLLDKTKSSLLSITSPNVEDEWKRFKNNHQYHGASHRFQLRKFLSRNIAASIAIGIVSFTAVAAIVSIGISQLRVNESSPTVDIKSETVVAISQTDSIRMDDEEKTSTPEIKIFNNENLDTILSEIATYYKARVIFENDAPKSLRLYFRWDKALNLNDVAERLNTFDQIHITVREKTIKVD